MSWIAMMPIVNEKIGMLARLKVDFHTLTRFCQIPILLSELDDQNAVLGGSGRLD